MPLIERLPSMLMGVLLAAYWGRVMRMAYKARRRWGRAANLVPAERVGRINRIVWAPIVMAWIVQPFLLAAIPERLPGMLRPVWFNALIAWPALAGAAVFLVLSRRCWRAMGKHWRMGIDPAERNPLIDVGPFSRVRHPIYSLSIGLMLATVLVAPTPLMFVVAVVHIGLLLWEARREERHLLTAHPLEYAVYRQRVPAFVPRLHFPTDSRTSAGL